MPRSSGRRRVVLAAALLLGIAARPVAAGRPDDVGGAARPGAPAVRVEVPERRASLAFVGDIHTLRRVNYAAQRAAGGRGFDYTPMFAEVAPLLEWFDLAVCAMEAPIAPPGTAIIVEPPLLSAAPELAGAMAAAGFDRCATAGNHIMDRGVAGVDATLAAFDAVGLTQAGTARSAAEASPAAQVVDVDGVPIAHLSYSWVIGREGVPPTQPWRANRLDPARVIADAAAARAAGALAVVVSFTWGTDKYVQPTAYQRQVAQIVTASGQVDLIVGQQAHVLQPIERVNGVWVVYGMGNFLSDLHGDTLWPPQSEDGMIVGVDVVVSGGGQVTIERPRIYPTWVDRLHGYVIRPVAQAADPTLPSDVRWALTLSRARTGALLGSFFGPGT